MPPYGVLNHLPLYPLLSLIIHGNTLGSTRLHQEQSHLLQQDTNQDVPDTVGNLTEHFHHKCFELGNREENVLLTPDAIILI